MQFLVYQKSLTNTPMQNLFSDEYLNPQASSQYNKIPKKKLFYIQLIK